MAMNVSQFVSSDNFNMAEFNDMISQINSGVNSEVAALTTLINSGAKIQTGSYTGTGTYGSSNPCSLTFNFVPKLFIISSTMGSTDDYDKWSMMYNPYNVSLGANSNYTNTVLWNANNVSWYSSAGKYQYNVNNCTYKYVVIGQ